MQWRSGGDPVPLEMTSLLKKTGYLALSFGVDPRRFLASLRSVGPFFANYTKVRRRSTADWPLELFPALGDRSDNAGMAKGHYFHTDLWAARIVKSADAVRVIDVGSRIDGFVAHVLAFRDIECFDIRPMQSNVAGLTFVQADVMDTARLPSGCADVLTSLHALEHFGLGRYGDPLDLDGWKKGMASFAHLLAPHGELLLAVPVGRQRIEFDAHRVFDPQTIIDEAARNGLTLAAFGLVDDAGDFHETAGVGDGQRQRYGCGCFRFRHAMSRA